MRLLIALLAVLSATAAEPLAIAASITDLGDLTARVGGDAVTVTVLARGDEDPHHLEVRPSLVKTLASAAIVVEIGLGYDTPWIDEALAQRPGPAPERWRASEAVSLIKPPPGDHEGHGHGPAKKSGHSHADGNPHFLPDPVAGAQVALALGAALGRTRPALAARFTAHAEAVALDLAERLVGPAAVARLGRATTLAALAAGDHTPLVGDDLGGWLARLRPVARMPLIADHDAWPYLARRFDLAIIAFLEPEPCVPPSTAHLTRVARLAEGAAVRGLLLGPWTSPRSIAPVTRLLGSRTAHLAPQAGALPGTASYLAACEANVTALAGLLP